MKRILSILLVSAMLLSFAGCAAKTTPTDAVKTEPTQAVSDELYIHVSCFGNLDYFYDHKLGTELAGKILGVKTEYVGPADYDMNAMVAAFEQAIAKSPAGIIVFGAEDTLAPVIDKASDAGIPVVCVDGDVPSSKRLAFVGTGQFNAGVLGAKALVEAIGGKGEVALMTFPGQAHLEARIAGYKSVLDTYPDIKIVQIGDTRTDPVVAAQAAAAIIQKYPNLAGIACVEASGGAGAMTAVKEADKVGDIKIISMDRGADVLQSIKEGVITATVVQQTALMPIYAMQILYNLKHNPVPIASDNVKAGLTGTPVNIDTGVVIVDKDNVDLFIR